MSLNTPVDLYFSGTVDQLSLTDLVQLCCLAQMDQRIEIESVQGSGIIVVKSGQVVHAGLERSAGETDFFEMLSWEGGRFDAAPPQNGEDWVTLAGGWEFLLIEAMRYRNERAAVNAGLGSLGSMRNFSGTIRNIRLADLVQLACMAGGDHVLEVFSDRQPGRIFVQSGQVVHAESDPLQGEDAFCEMLLADRGRFEDLPCKARVSVTISKPWEYLLMDAMRYRDEKLDVGEEQREEKARDLLRRVQRMKVAEKIRLAMTGDKEARTLLVRDAGRLIQLAVIGNPRITDGEVVSIANSRNVDEEVLRRIANNREWMRHYQVRHALATNPKCPLPIAARLVQTLMAQDLKVISRSKSVPTGVAQAARRLIQR